MWFNEKNRAYLQTLRSETTLNFNYGIIYRIIGMYMKNLFNDWIENCTLWIDEKNHVTTHVLERRAYKFNEKRNYLSVIFVTTHVLKRGKWIRILHQFMRKRRLSSVEFVTGFTQKQTMKTHVHQGEKRYHCGICDSLIKSKGIIISMLNQFMRRRNHWIVHTYVT